MDRLPQSPLPDPNYELHMFVPGEPGYAGNGRLSPACVAAVIFAEYHNNWNAGYWWLLLCAKSEGVFQRLSL